MQPQSDLSIDRKGLRKRTFLLGNKRAFSLSLPAAGGSSDVLQHPHKWFGAYHYGRKYLEGQVVRAVDHEGRMLGEPVQTGFTMSLTSAQREYEIGGLTCSEEFFVPDGIQGIVCFLEGSLHLAIEPQFDMRFSHALNDSCEGYQVEPLAGGAVVSAALPSGRYDDATETFLPLEDGSEHTHLWAAVQVVGEGSWSEPLPASHHARRKLFPRDLHRRHLVSQVSDDAADHAPLWKRATSRVFAPVRLHVPGRGMVVYGFGSSREEALQQLSQLRDNVTAFQVQKTTSLRGLLDQAALETGSPRVDLAYAHVLARLMDALVARHAAAENTALDRPATMILAGNQYFHDSWKRDENIALGFLLAIGQYDLARDVIRDTWQLQDEITGRLPQRIRAGEAPAYHSSDGTLWALLRLHQYWQVSGDDSVLREKLSMVEVFFRRSLERAVDGMLPSGRTSDPDYLWETWMDTHHTPRHGFPVEIQMLWISVLRNYRPLFRERDAVLEAAMERAESAAWSALNRFNIRGLPADSLDESGFVRDLITPNAYFCFGLGLDLGAEMEGTMRAVGRRHLAGSHGIRTLAPVDWERVYSAEFLADRRHVRGNRMRSVGKLNYHQGVEWNWLSRFFVEADLKYGDPDLAYRTYLRSHVESVLMRSGIGGISELHDLSGARGPEFQAWSMSGFLEAIHAFAGVQIDVPGKRIAVQPQLPSDWPHIRVRKWYGRIPLDVSMERSERGLQVQLHAPWGEPPDAEVDLGLILPDRWTVYGVDVTCDSNPHSIPWEVVPIEGTSRSRLALRFAARADVQVRVSLVRQTRRLKASA